MRHIDRAARTFNLLTAAGAEMTETALKMGEMVMASSTVIGVRTAMGAQAMQDPDGADHDEFNRMSAEKIDAFTAAGSAVLEDMQNISQTMVRSVVNHTTGYIKAAFGVSAALHPLAAIEAQRRWVLETMALVNRDTLRLTEISAGVSATALAPVHFTATNNARRLTGIDQKAAE